MSKAKNKLLYIMSLLLIFVYEFVPKKCTNKENRTVAIITGGELFNKGAEAMVFTAVTLLYETNPAIKEIYVLSSQDAARPKHEKDKFLFTILPSNNGALPLSFLPNFILKKLKNPVYKKIKEVFSMAHIVVDISGLKLSSHMNIDANINYLLTICRSKKDNIPMFLLPQSFGPFTYKFPYSFFLVPLIRNILKYPRKIYPREPSSVRNLKRIGVSNLTSSSDIVLTEKINPRYVFKEILNIKKLSISENSVLLIPNKKIDRHIDTVTLYTHIINTLNLHKKNIYLLPHSSQDLEICTTLYNKNKHITLLQEFTSLDTEDNIGKFDYVIASRYHGIIHAFKQKIPVVIIGWADKYIDLARQFDQSAYVIDVREKNALTEAVKAISKMNKESKKEKIIIQTALKKIPSINLSETSNNL